MVKMKEYLLKDYISELEAAGLLVDTDVSAVSGSSEIKDLTFDTREMKEGALFVCKGAHFKREYLETAYNNGAVAYVSEIVYDGCKNRVIVSDIRRAMSILAVKFFDDAPSKLVSVGITGTKGKSTTAYYLRNILNLYLADSGKPDCAVISSIDTYDGIVNKESHLTTPEAIDLFRHFDNAVSTGISHLVMEVSSQALKYGRVDGINFDVACFNNIGLDHISPAEHESFEDYYAAKLKLLDTCKVACINSDDEHSPETLSYADGKCRVITYGSHEDDTVYCEYAEKREDGIYFRVRTPEYDDVLSITMPGMFNVSNALAAVAMSYVLGIPAKYVKSGLRTARASGRMQVYTSEDSRVVVVVDYAHNRMSFEALYNAVGIEYPSRDVITIFGCPGSKAFLRRHDLGELAGKNSDYVIITEEDSGEEPFDNIASDIAVNVAAENCRYDIIENRGEAIRRGIIDYGSRPRIILITGKGEETRQKRGTKYIDCPSDVDYTLSCLKEYNAAVLASN